MTTGFDTIIIGAGSAGCTLAGRLSEDSGRQVLLLEAGPDHRADDLPDELRYLSRSVTWPYDWGDNVHSIRDRMLFYGRGRGVGGSSGTNGGVAMRPEEPDFASWPKGWQWNDMLPYFCRLERDMDFAGAPWHGADGPVPIVRWKREEWAPLQVAFHDGCVALGFAACADHNQPGTTGVGPIPMNRAGRARISAMLAYVEPARDRSNLAVRGDAHVRRLVLEGRRAVGVELVDGEVIKGGEIILASGVVQNPLLLWRSGIGPAEGVGALGIQPAIDLPAVGSHLTDHLVVTFASEIPRDIVVEDAPSIQTILRVTAPNSDRVHDLQITPFVRRHADGRRSIAMSVSLQLPTGAGTITPASAEPDQPARIVWPFADDPDNQRRLRAGWRLAAGIAKASAISIDPDGIAKAQQLDDDQLDELIAAEHSAFYHGVGTCRMGDYDDSDSVVDPQCRVHGVDGLRIVDTSIIPTVPRSNTNLAAIAVAERATELIRTGR